jgi:hypothetical protein
MNTTLEERFINIYFYPSYSFVLLTDSIFPVGSYNLQFESIFHFLLF